MNAGDKAVALVPFLVLIVVLSTIAYRAHIRNHRARVLAATDAPRYFPRGVRTADVVFRCECCGQRARQTVTAFEQDWVCGPCKLVLTEAGAS